MDFFSRSCSPIIPFLSIHSPIILIINLPTTLQACLNGEYILLTTVLFNGRVLFKAFEISESIKVWYIMQYGIQG